MVYHSKLVCQFCKENKGLSLPINACRCFSGVEAVEEDENEQDENERESLCVQTAKLRCPKYLKMPIGIGACLARPRSIQLCARSAIKTGRIAKR